MYLRRHNKKVDGDKYDCWSLVESVRTPRGPRQRIVAAIGTLPGPDEEERVGREEVRRILEGKPLPQPGLFEPGYDPPLWATVNINKVRVERLRHFGDIYPGLLVWNTLGFADFCKEHITEGREEIPWSIMASILARSCAPSSELQIAESWYEKTALDALLPYKDDLCRHLQDRYGEMFNTTLDFPPLLILKEGRKVTGRQKGAIAGTAVPTVLKYASAFRRPKKDCPSPLRSSMATVLM